MPETGYTKRRAAWSEDDILDAIRRWAADHDGMPPTATEWNPSDCRYSAELSTARAEAWLARADDFEAGEYPWTGSVVKRFGSWNDAIRRAGFTPRRRTILDGAYERVGPRRRPTLAGIRSSLEAAAKARGEARRRALLAVARTALRLAEAER